MYHIMPSESSVSYLYFIIQWLEFLFVSYQIQTWARPVLKIV